MLGNGAGNDERLNFKEQTGADRNTVAVYGTQRGETLGGGVDDGLRRWRHVEQGVGVVGARRFQALCLERLRQSQAAVASLRGAHGEACEAAVFPPHVYFKPSARLQPAHAPFFPCRGQCRQQVNGSVVALHEHLGDARRAPEVAVDLERRVGVHHVGICSPALLLCAEDEEGVGGQRQLVGNEFVGVVAVEQPCPSAHLPSHRPSCGNVASRRERCPGGGGQPWRAEGRNLAAGEQSVDM